MNDELMIQTLDSLSKQNYPAYVKAIISIETGVKDQAELDVLYDRFMMQEDVALLNDNIYKWMK